MNPTVMNNKLRYLDQLWKVTGAINNAQGRKSIEDRMASVCDSIEKDLQMTVIGAASQDFEEIEPTTDGWRQYKPIGVRKLTVQVELQTLDLFKDVLAAMVLMYDKADEATELEVIEILKDQGSALLVKAGE